MPPRIATLEEIDAAPKIDLHAHLDGSVSKDRLIRLSEKHEIPLDPQILQYYPDAGPFDAHARPDEFKRFLDCFQLPLALMQTPETIHDTTLEVIRDLNSQNVVYAELRFAPNYSTTQGHSMEEMIASVVKAMEDGYRETGVLTKLVIAVPREIAHVGDSSDNNITAEDIVKAAMSFEGNGVVAIDLACAEHFGPEPYIDLFRSTIGSQLKRTVHAGEAGPQRARNVEIAINQMGANGLGHALTLNGTEDSNLLRTIIERGIRIERCPLSNLALLTSDGNLDGLQRLMQLGALVSISSDDFGIYGPTTRVGENLLYVAQKLKLGPEGIRRLTLNAANSAFLAEPEKQSLIGKIESHYGMKA